MSGERFRQARELRGLTQTELAARIGVAQSLIASVESDVSPPSDALLRAFAFQCGFPLSHFEQDDPPDFTFGSLMYRSRVALTARERRVAYRYGQVAFELAEKLGARLRTVPLNIPRVEEPPRRAAAIMRSALGISPDAPIGKLVNTLERHGVIVLASPVRAQAHDAFSLRAGANRERAVIVIAAGMPGDRSRFTISHEVRHLTSTARGDRKEIESDADKFAAEFLLPEEAMRNELVPPITLSSLAPLKPRWGVAIQTLIRRAYELEIISDRQYRYLMQQVGARGWRTKEPMPLHTERPRALRQMAEMLYGNPPDYVRLAADVKMSSSLVKQIIELHAGATATPPTEGTRPPTAGRLLALKPRSAS